MPFKKNTMRTSVIYMAILLVVTASALPAPAKDQSVRVADTASLVPTFHCMSLYWSPTGGSAEAKVLVRFRQSGQQKWRPGLPLRFNPVDTSECKGDYRGSLVNLLPGTSYEIELSLEGTGQKTVCQGTTWSEEFPVETVVPVSDRDTTLTVDRSGTPDGYVLYDGTGCTIDTGNNEGVGIAVNASYVILRGFSIKHVKEYGIRIFGGHHIVIEDCDISQWGSESEKGWGMNYQGGIYSKEKDLRAVVIQRCRIHHPSWDSNSWAELHGHSTHPKGPQTIVFRDSAGNHVIRYNECWSDENHYFNDGIGAGSNSGDRGFPGADSDIYCNYIANCWDDGIEAEGGDQNVRVWNNYVEDVLIPIANAAVTIGPLYIWRNVSGRSDSPAGDRSNFTHGPFMKMGHASDETRMRGHSYIFNNTIFQEGNRGADGLGGGSRIIKHCTTRNNILHVREGDRQSIAVSGRHADNDFDYDLTSAGFPDDHEEHGLSGSPKYVPGAGFDSETRTGRFQLLPGSTGFDAGIVIPNFCDVFNGKRPDLGAHESETEKMQFGVKARFIPPGTTEVARKK